MLSDAIEKSGAAVPDLPSPKGLDSFNDLAPSNQGVGGDGVQNVGGGVPGTGDPNVGSGVPADPNVGGGVPADPNVGVTVVTPTIEPTVDAEAARLEAAEAILTDAYRSYDFERAFIEADTFRLHYPDNELLDSVDTVLGRLAALKQSRQSLPTKTGYVLNEALLSPVRNTLAGNSYVVVSINKSVMRVYCLEVATIEQMDGWFTGERYMVQLCLLEQFDATHEGDRFAVDGNNE